YQFLVRYVDVPGTLLAKLYLLGCRKFPKYLSSPEVVPGSYAVEDLHTDWQGFDLDAHRRSQAFKYGNRRMTAATDHSPYRRVSEHWKNVATVSKDALPPRSQFLTSKLGDLHAV